MKKVCVILGAGASFDVDNGGSPLNEPDLRPPLAKDLFDMEGHKNYWNTMSQYPGAQFISGLIASRISAENFDLETELRHYAEHPDPRTKGHYKHVPPYLRDLLHRVSVNYTHMPGSYVHLVYELLAENPHEVLFLVLNYDDLLERALGRFDSGFDFTQIDHYVRNGRQAKIVKFHGSINWFFQIGEIAGHTWHERLNEYDILSNPPGRQIYVLNVTYAIDLQIDDYWGYPLLTAPLAGKGITDMVSPQSHMEAAREFLKDCKKFLIIGTSGLDEDLLEFLDSSIEPPDDILIHAVGMDNKAVSDSLSRFTTRVSAFKNRTDEQAQIRENGFRSYLANGDIRTFAEFDI